MLICGGYGERYDCDSDSESEDMSDCYLSDVVLMDVTTKTMRKIGNMPEAFYCQNQTYIKNHGVLLSLVKLSDNRPLEVISFEVEQNLQLKPFKV